MSDINQFAGWVLGMKEMSLDDRTQKIRDAVRAKFLAKGDGSVDVLAGYGGAPATPDFFYVSEVYPDYAIVCKNTEHFKVNFVCQDGVVSVSDQIIPVEKVWREKV